MNKALKGDFLAKVVLKIQSQRDCMENTDVSVLNLEVIHSFDLNVFRAMNSHK